jgi:class 3 adenylate cyclase
MIAVRTVSTRNRDVTPNGHFELISVYKDEWGDFSTDERRWRLTDLRDNRQLGRWTHEADDDIASVRFGPRFDRVIITMPDATTRHLLLPDAVGEELVEDPASKDTVFVVGYLDREALSYAPLTGKHEVAPHRDGSSDGFFQRVGEAVFGVFTSSEGPVYFRDAERFTISANVSATVTPGDHESHFVLRRRDQVIDEVTYPRVSRSSWGYDNWSADEESADFFMWLASHAPTDWLRERFTSRERDETNARAARELLIVFADVTRFRVNAARLGDADLAEMMNEYYERMRLLVTSSNGRIVKFMGDALFAIWLAEDSARAVADLPTIKRGADAFFDEHGWPDSRLVIKAHFGSAIAGEFGDTFDVVGNQVNFAARLPARTIAISPEAFHRLAEDDRAAWKKDGEVYVPDDDA